MHGLSPGQDWFLQGLRHHCHLLAVYPLGRLDSRAHCSCSFLGAIRHSHSSVPEPRLDLWVLAARVCCLDLDVPRGVGNTLAAPTAGRRGWAPRSEAAKVG